MATALLTIQEVARVLNVSAGCVYGLVKAGRIACHRIGLGRGTVRISADDLGRYLESSKSQPGEAVARRLPRLKLKHLRA